MNFADALAQTRKQPGVTCSFAKLRDGLNPKDRAQLDDAMAADKLTVPNTHIARAVHLLTGKKIDPDIVSRHRRGDCRHCAED